MSDLADTGVSSELVSLWASTRAPTNRVRPHLDAHRIMAGVKEGERNSALFKLVSKFRADGVPREEAERDILQAAAKSTPPLKEAEAMRIVESAYSRYAPNAPELGDEDWSAPAAFNSPPVPAFPTETLPATLRRFVEAESVATQTAPDLAAMVGLGVIAASVQKKVEVAVTDGWREPTNLWPIVAQPPGTRKSAVFRDATAPIEDWERHEAERLADAIQHETVRQELLEARRKHAITQAARTTDETKLSELTNEVHSTSAELHSRSVPVAPRIIADDVTPERLCSLMLQHNGAIAVLSPEGDLFDMMAGRYSQTVTLGPYLKGHAGDNIRIDRVNRAPEFIRAPALTLALTVQPDVIAGLASRPSFRGRGICARFLYSIPRTTLGARDVSPPTMPPDVRQSYHDNITSLLEMPFATDENGGPAAHVLHVSTHARASLNALASRIEPQLADGARLAPIADWVAKLPGAVVRIAGLIHVAERVNDLDVWEREIDEHTMSRAITVGGYLLAHAQAAFALMGADPLVEKAKYLLRWIERTQRAAFSRRDAFEGCRSEFRKVVELDPVLELLIEHGYIRRRPEPGEKRKGRPNSPTYDVNPIYSQKPQKGRDVDGSANCADSASEATEPVGEATVAPEPSSCSQCGRAVLTEGQPCDHHQPEAHLTAEAAEVLAKVRAGGVPAFVTNNLRRIALENGMPDAHVRDETEIVAYLQSLDAAFRKEVL